MFRSYVKSGNDKKEVKGVPCMMTGDGFRSRFVTPAKLTAPVFGPKTKPVRISCKYQDQTRAKTLTAVNKTQSDANKSLVTLKSATSVTGAVIAAAKIGTAMAPRDKAQDVYKYRDSAIVFINKKE